MTVMAGNKARLALGSISKRQFQALFVLGPLLFCTLIPSMIWTRGGSNVLWGSVFGLGWCLAAFAEGKNVDGPFAFSVGFLWGWLVLIPLYFGSGWLWEKLTPARRVVAAIALMASLLLIAPTDIFQKLKGVHGVHVADYTWHISSMP